MSLQDRKPLALGEARFCSIVAFIVAVATAITMTSATRHDNRGEQVRRIVRLNDFDNCKDRAAHPYHFTEHAIALVAKNVWVFNAQGLCNRPTQKIEKVELNITKCSDRSKMKCEHFRRLEWKNSAVICPMLEMTHMPWSNFLEMFRPPIRCVNRKGHFTVTNMTVDFGLLSKMGFQWSEYYVSQWQFVDEKSVPWLCFTAETDFPQVRRGGQKI